MAIIINHANLVNAGSALKVRALNGWFQFSICTRRWNEDGLSVMADLRGIGEILSVLHGIQESINDGKGIRRGGDVLQVSHEIDPRPGFRFTILSSADGEKVRRTILLDCCEALALSEAIRSAMGRVFLCD